MSNIQPYIILNGTDSRSITGLLISALAPISKPLQRTLVDTVDGRDGDLVTPLGFSAYDKTISIALTYGYDIDDIIEYFNSEGVVTFSNEPDKYYRYAIYEQIDFERLIRFKTAEVTLHCQPFKFSTTETPKLFNVTSGSPITVKNDGNYQSRPNLTIIGSGDVDLSLNGSQILSLDLEDNQAIIIDTEDMNAYAAQTAIKEVIAEINPVQDLNGYESPWIDSNEVNKTPYLERSINGTATRIGNRLYDKLVGGTVVLNQQAQDPNFSDTSTKWKIYSTSNGTYSQSNGIGTITYNGNYTGGYACGLTPLGYTIQFYTSHKYLVIAKVKADFDTKLWLEIGTSTGISKSITTNQWVTCSWVAQRPSWNSSNSFLVKPVESTIVNGSTLQFDYVQLIDLTQMFGSTIADYIYNLEQSTAGAGVAWFKNLFDKDYYAYNAGELMSVKTSAHIFRDASNNIVSNNALDPDLELRGIPKLDANNNLYYDGDEYESDGTVTRRYGIVDLGSLTWTITKNDSTAQEFRTTNFTGCKGVTDTTMPNIISKLTAVTRNSQSNNYIANTIGITSTSRAVVVVAPSSYTDEAAFKTAMSGVYLVYELATPTTEQADAFTNPQVCIAGGTEQYVDSRTVPIPVGHESYFANFCPITGFTESNVTLFGVNIWDEAWEIGAINTSTGQNVNVSTTIRSTNYIPCIPSTPYYRKSPQNIIPFFYDKNKGFISFSGWGKNNAITTPNNAYYMRFYVDPAYGTTYNNDISINYPASYTDYAPYLGSEYTIEFVDDQGDPITAYKGRINFTTGVLTLDRAMVVYDGSEDENWTIASDGTQRIPKPANCVTTDDRYSISNTLRTTYLTTVPVGYMRIGTSNCIFNIKNFDDIESIKLYLSNNPLQLLYPLATPIEIQLTPTIINNLLGLNQMYADNNGDISVTFSSDGVIRTETGDIVSFNVAVEDMQKGILLNRLVIGDYDKIRLSKGNNTIVLSGGAQQFVIDKYSRWL